MTVCKFLTSALISFGVVGLFAHAANAGEIVGTFSGTVTATDTLDGIYDGISGSSLIGDSINGNVLFSSSYPPDSSPIYQIYFPPISFSVTIGSNTFTLSDPAGYVYLGNPGYFQGNQYLEADAYNGSTLFDADIEAPSLYGNSSNLDSISFQDLSGLFFMRDNNGGTFDWEIPVSLSFVASSPVPVPEPGTLALFGVALLALGGLSLRRKFV